MTNMLIAIASIGVLLANVFLICFIYKQVRHLYKPIITIKVTRREKSVEERPSVLEYGDLYLVISNVSKNQARRLTIHYEFLLGNAKIAQINKTLSYLNPGEATREPLELGKVIRERPDLFQEITEGKSTKIIPKKTLKLLLQATVTCNFPKYKVDDSYEIHWDSLENLPDFENHPSTLCWNRRDGTYIHKHKEFY